MERTDHPWLNEIRATLALSWPLVLSNLTMSLIGATDVLMLGWLGPRELAGATLGLNFALIFLIFAIGLVTASAPLMATEIGRRAHSVRDIRRTFRQTVWAAATVAVPVWAVLWFTRDIMLVFGQQPDLAGIAGTYVRVYMPTIFLYLVFLVMRNFIAALEEPVWALLISVVGVVANALFNYALIFGNFGAPALGVVGAGLGSVLTNALMVAGLGLVIVGHQRFRRYRLFGNFWRVDWGRYREVWRLGLPIAVTFGLEGSVFSLAAILMGLIDAASVAAHAIALQLAAVSFMVPMGVAQAATVRVGIHHGRRDPTAIGRAGWTAFVIGTGFMTVMAAVFMLFPEALVGMFIDEGDPGTARVAELAVGFLFLAAVFQVVDGAQVVAAGMLRGLHDTTWPMAFALVGYWIIGMGVGGWLAFRLDWDGVGIWTGLAAGLGVVAVLMLWRWMLRRRLGLVETAT